MKPKMIQLVIEEFYNIETKTYDRITLGAFQSPAKAKKAIEIAISKQISNMGLEDLGEDYIGNRTIGSNKVVVTYKRQRVDVFTNIEDFKKTIY